MRYSFITLLFFSYPTLSDESESIEVFINKKQSENQSMICDSFELLDSQQYCITESKITLNSCGKETDWPCLDAEGCLEIKKYVRNVHE